MRRCLCCISVNVGAVVLGFIGIILTVCELIPLVAYLTECENFNPIKDNLDNFFYLLETSLSEEDPLEDTEPLMSQMKKYVWPTLLTETISASIYFLSALLLISGIYFRLRFLMLPYLALTLLYIIIGSIILLALVVLLFLVNVIYGSILLVAVLLGVSAWIYFWFVVQSSYVHLHSDEHMYSPAPTKPPFSDSLYPSVPQRFQMEEPHKNV